MFYQLHKDEDVTFFRRFFSCFFVKSCQFSAFFRAFYRCKRLELIGEDSKVDFIVDFFRETSGNVRRTDRFEIIDGT